MSNVGSPAQRSWDRHIALRLLPSEENNVKLGLIRIVPLLAPLGILCKGTRAEMIRQGELKLTILNYQFNKSIVGTSTVRFPKLFQSLIVLRKKKT